MSKKMLDEWWERQNKNSDQTTSTNHPSQESDEDNEEAEQLKRTAKEEDVEKQMQSKHST